MDPLSYSYKVEEDYTAIQSPRQIGLDAPAIRPYQLKSPLLRECLAEFLGTFILVLFGDGAVAQVTLSEKSKGNYTTLCLGWGIGILFGIHVSGGVSGAHINPAITTTLALFKRFQWRKVVPYIVAQTLGAFVAAFLIWAVYKPLFDVVDPEKATTQGIFATYPYSSDVSVGTCFLTEMVGTALLLCGLFAIGDELNKPANPYSQPSAVALLVVGIGMAFGMNTGFALNPARDFGPRLFTLCAGWGSQVFTLRNAYFWVPIVAPLLGGAIGAGVYVGLVEHHHPREYSQQQEGQFPDLTERVDLMSTSSYKL
ncbi:Aquaporin-9 [Phytophthora nicotianae]|uniref:Aquaporin-9 n=1 Tax=Phytophthora nicotianae TaxID=4792 RepID=A0A0W8CCF5_PHYNI|nr:Aquaporin-9 [Phytophthora nicotianae]